MAQRLDMFFQSFLSDAQRPLFFLLVGFIVTFALARFSTRVARAGVLRRFRPGSIVTSGGLHIHHAVPGLVGMVVFGILAFAFMPGSPYIEILAFGFGSGAALALDEFALILHLQDVYWAGQGRASIDAVVLGVTFIVLLLTGLLPASIQGLNDVVGISRSLGALLLIVAALFVIVCYLKGKLFMGTVGIFVLPVAVVGAVRLAKPNSPWAHLRYTRDSFIMERARRRDERFHRRWTRRKHWVWDLIGGKPHLHLPPLVPGPALERRDPGEERTTHSSAEPQPKT
jgi:lysyl-tRNA synthetase class 2